MNKYWRCIKSIRQELLILFIIAFLTIILIDFWLIKVPQKFDGGAKIGSIVYRLCISYISAFIFYFLVVHLKNQKDKENIYSYISSKINSIVLDSKDLAQSMSIESDVKMEGTYPTEEELNSICKVINPHSKAPLIINRVSNYANWIQYLNYYKERSNKTTQKIYLKMHFLDSDLVNLLAKIEDCTYFESIGLMIKIMPIGNIDLLAFAPELMKYFDLIKDLEKYYNEKLIDYK